MPYKVQGNKVLHKKNGVWKVKQVCSSHENALKAVGLLHMKGYGSKEKKKGKKKKKI